MKTPERSLKADFCKINRNIIMQNPMKILIYTFQDRYSASRLDKTLVETDP